MTWEIADGDFDEQWTRLESPFRRKIAALANSGKTSDDVAQAALILAFARRRLGPLELWGPVLAGIVAYAAIVQLFFGGPEALHVALVIGGLCAFTLVRRGRLEAAIAKSEEVVANAPPRLEPAGEPEGDEPESVG